MMKTFVNIDFKTTHALRILKKIAGMRKSIIVTLLIRGAILSVALFPAGCVDTAFYANMHVIGNHGVDIRIAIAGTNIERETQGLPPIWPSDAPPYKNHITGRVECFNFDNSTDYFAYILDIEHYGTEKWQPLILGVDFDKLAGAGVTPYVGTGPLKAENNMWTIAKNITDEMDDVIPILLTRNLDAECLLSVSEGEPRDNKILCGETWDTPFGKKGAVLIRKGGGTFNKGDIVTVCSKFATPSVLYKRQSFNANRGSKYPLKYLTPTKEVVPIGKMR